jgi:hypothetical protein
LPAIQTILFQAIPCGRHSELFYFKQLFAADDLNVLISGYTVRQMAQNTLFHIYLHG